MCFIVHACKMAHACMHVVSAGCSCPCMLAISVLSHVTVGLQTVLLAHKMSHQPPCSSPFPRQCRPFLAPPPRRPPCPDALHPLLQILLHGGLFTFTPSLFAGRGVGRSKGPIVIDRSVSPQNQLGRLPCQPPACTSPDHAVFAQTLNQQTPQLGACTCTSTKHTTHRKQRQTHACKPASLIP